MEERKAKIYAVNRHPSVTFLPVTSDLHIIQGQVLQFLQCPGGKHNPGHNGVDQEDEGIGDSGRHTIRLSARTCNLWATEN